jgi:hydrogenase maturation protein HypF
VTSPSESVAARHYLITGRVQGVGYRPFVYRAALRFNLRGWVRNVTGSVEIHAEGDASDLVSFSTALIHAAPAIARPVLTQEAPAELAHHDSFAVLPSQAGEANIHVPPDYFVCDDCLREMNDPANRRYRYPFINCTQCGPRYTLIESLPYDRPGTSMKAFELCPDCAGEYANPLDRRFHAEPIACPVCGPQLVFVDPDEAAIEGNEAALVAAVRYLENGHLLAVKGIGGYHLMCDARNDEAVARLRTRKPRPFKPLAAMFPADGKALAEAVECDAAQLAFLQSPQRPILLLPKKPGCTLSKELAPGLNEIGCLLPYSPLHALLLEGFGNPLVATSGNLSGEPVLTDNAEAQTRLANIADAFLHHNRPIVRPADDAVYRVIAGKPRPLRLGRGIAPLELELPGELPEPVLALGAHTKNAIALAWKNRVIISPHIGDLSSLKSMETLARVANDLQHLYQVKATRLLLDRHPGYGYRRFARDSGLPLFEVWHHHAHASALAWEFPAIERCIVFAWDGVGLGEDGELWGGETFIGTPGQWQRAATLRPFRLPGGEQAGREPWRSAAALLWETGHPAPFAPDLLHAAWLKGINAPVTHAAGRLFDAAAALTGICPHASFEGEGPMKLEAAAIDCEKADAISLPISKDGNGVWQTNWSPLLPVLLDHAHTPAQRAACFHASLAHALLDQALRLREQTGINDIGLTGGVFQNKLLTETAKNLLEQHRFQVRIPEQIPVNDAGVCLGQVMEFLHLCRQP